MTDLIQNMSLLSTMVPAVPDQIEPVSNEAAAVVAAARKFLEGVEEKRKEAATLLEQVTNALSDLKDATSEDQQRLRGALDAARTALDAAVSALNDGEMDVRVAAKDAGDKLRELQQTVARAAQRATAAQEGLTNSASAAVDGFEDAQSEIESAVGTAAGTAEKVEDAMTDGQAKVKAAADTLDEALEPIPEAVQALLGDCTQRIQTEHGALEGAVGGAVDDLASRSDGLLEALRDALGESQEPLTSAASEVTNALGDMGGAALGPVEDLVASRADAVTALQTLAAEQTALEGGVASVRAAAQSAGIEWPA